MQHVMYSVDTKQKELNGLKIEELSISQEDQHRIQQKFMTRLVEPMSKVFQGNFSIIFSMFCVIPVYFHIYDVSIDENVDNDNILKMLKSRTKLTFDSIPLSSAYCCIDPKKREIEIHISFFKEKNIALDEFIDKLISLHSKTLGFIYMHEIMHIFNRDLESYNSHIKKVQELFKEIKGMEIDKSQAQSFSNIACDFHINSTLLRNISVFNDGSFINFILYSKNYNSDKMTVYDIMADVIKTAEIETYNFNIDGYEPNDNENNSDNQSNNGNTSPSKGTKTGKIVVSRTEAGKIVTVDMETEIKDNIDKDQLDPKDITTTSDMIKDIVNDMVAKVRGMGSSEILSSLGIPLDVKMNWARKLKRRLGYLCSEKTDKNKTTWSNPNKYTKHIAVLPGPDKKFKMPTIYVAVDSSGSMSNDDLRKINYILKELNTKGYPITVIVHDYNINKIDKFKPKDTAINKFIKFRYSCGGTSHIEVFKYIENELKTYADYKKAIVLIASDMYSDIDKIYDKYKWTRYVSTIGLVLDSYGSRSKKYKMPFGETIYIE